MRHLIGEIYRVRKQMRTSWKQYEVRVSVLIGSDKEWVCDIPAVTRSDARTKCEKAGIKPWNF